MLIRFTVPGKAQPKGSKRAFVVKGRAIMTDASSKTKLWQNAVSDAAGSVRNLEELICGPVRISVTFVFARPRSHYRTGKNAHRLRDGAPHYHTGKPDIDKLIRTLGDGLTGVLLTDDAIVAHWSAWKVYGQFDETEVNIETLERPTP